MRDSSWTRVLALSLALSSFAMGEEKNSEEAERDLISLRKRIAEARRETLDAEKLERGVLSELSRLDKEIEDADKTAKSCEKRIESNVKDLRDCQEELLLLTEELDQIRGSLSKAVGALHRTKRVSAPQVFLGAVPMAEHIRRRACLGAVAGRLAAMSLDAREKTGLAKERSDTLNRITEEQKRLKREAEESRESLLEIQSQRKEILGQVRSEVATHKKALKEMEAAEVALKRFMDSLGDLIDTTEQVMPFSVKRGSLPWPVRGRILKGFGKSVDPKLQTSLLHKGLDIQVDRGETVRCVHPGKVLFADWFRGYGKLVILDHGEGYCTLYAHNDEVLVEVGSQVEAQQPIARAGETGSLGGAKLYFEVRKDNVPVDPRDWLSSR